MTEIFERIAIRLAPGGMRAEVRTAPVTPPPTDPEIRSALEPFGPVTELDELGRER